MRWSAHLKCKAVFRVDQNSRQRQTLALSNGKHLTRIRQFIGQLRLKTAFIIIDLFFHTKRIHNILHFCIRINLCIHRNILSDGRSINIDILKDNSVLASIVLYIVVTNIFLIISDGSLIRIVQAQNIQSARQHSTNGK